MEANYGRPNEATAEPAKAVYSKLEHLVKDKRTNFMSLADESFVLNDAKTKGVPCMDKADSNGLLKYLSEI
ncbi:hypothetical protein JXA85_06445 [Candidatus Woesearchaeota archaeon]|nr:hypothetical protein [Candidatus Woesearchaeota archaeon]